MCEVTIWCHVWVRVGSWDVSRRCLCWLVGSWLMLRLRGVLVVVNGRLVFRLLMRLIRWLSLVVFV